MSEDNLKKPSGCKSTKEKDLDVIFSHIEKQKSHIIIIPIVAIIILLLSVIGGISYNCYKDIQINQNKLKSPDQSIDSVKTDCNYETKTGGSAVNLPVHDQRNTNTRSNCFWFIIFSIIALLLILLFSLVSFSSKESKLLQFITDSNEQEKEIKLKDIEKEIELQKLKKEK